MSCPAPGSLETYKTYIQREDFPLFGLRLRGEMGEGLVGREASQEGRGEWENKWEREGKRRG